MTYRYKTVKRGGKTVLLHRWLMAQHLGRELLPTEHVHHLNHNAHDNRIENLSLVAPVEHQSHHHPAVHALTKTCVICGGVFRPEKTKRKRAQVCSWACRNALIAVKRHGVPLEEARTRITRRAA